MKNINKSEEESLSFEINYILQTGANDIRILRLIDVFLERRKLKEIIYIPKIKSINFREMRKTKRLTLRKVEEITGISNAYLSQLETGKIKSPGYEIVRKLYETYK